MAPAPARAVAHPAAPIPDGKLLDQGRQRRAAPRLRLHAEGVPGEIIQDINLYGEMHRFLPVLAAWVGSRVTELEVPHHPRTRGASKYSIRRTYKVIVDLVTIKFIADYSARPNYVFAGAGLVSLALGVLAFGIAAYRVLVLHHIEATPMVFLMVLFVMTGVFSLFIGFLAETVIRGFHETQRKPTYYIREIVTDDRTRHG